ncbi:helix-hairpin-helix domain-containing protein [Pediococcus acidilactici]|uniref:helix-hairpin-helix domain-containing protein n=1 Tax=Pediococcus acidilactici TaxID=1254 RepID=UPI00254F6876|nr:helix-hairpin-helix domain-containing protein [Pediococcus acidilactici]WIL72535.1 helix-hairpin-helix domain-containing protein [Pediococcus acidilactici]
MWEEIWEKYQKPIIIGSILMAAILLVVSLLRPKNNVQSPQENSEVMMAGSEAQSSSVTSNPSTDSVQKSAGKQKLMVDVKGAVKKPGVYEVKPGMRVVDGIELDGGLTESADRKNINMALQLSDQQVVYIPIKGEIKDFDPKHLMGTAGNAGNESLASSSSAGELVNINTADKNALLTLNGIGDKKADQIISYREEQGGFKTIDDLKQVQGIGDKIFAGLKDSITV